MAHNERVLLHGVRLTVIKFSVESEPIPGYRFTGSVCRFPRLARDLTILQRGSGLLNIILKYALLMEIQRIICSFTDGCFLLSPLAETAPFFDQRVSLNNFRVGTGYGTKLHR